MATPSLLLAAVLAAAAPSDAESPKAVAHAYFDALTRGDADAALALVANPSDEDRALVTAGAASAGGLAGLEDLAKSHFGPRGELGIAARHRRLLDAIDRAPVVVNGDGAELRPEGERPVRLRKVGGRWKVASPAERLSADERKTLRELQQRTDAVTKDLGGRIQSGASKSADEVRDALRRALGRNGDEGVPL